MSPTTGARLVARPKPNEMTSVGPAMTEVAPVETADLTRGDERHGDQRARHALGAEDRRDDASGPLARLSGATMPSTAI